MRSLGQFSSFLTAAAAAGLLLTVSACSDDDGDNGVEQKLIILHLNDFHSQLLGFDPNLDYTPGTTGDDATVGGIARIAAKVKQIRAEAAAAGIPVLAFDSGDFTVGTMFVFLGLSHAPEMSLLKDMGFDATTIGNHECDGTTAGAAAYFKAAADLGVNIPVVASNFVFSEADPGDDALAALFDSGVIERRRVIEVGEGGLKVGLLGYMGNSARSNAPLLPPADVSDIKDAAEATIAALQADGAELIIALSHAGLSDNPTKNEDVMLAQQVSGLDLILSGHSHTLTEQAIIAGDTIITQEGDYGRYLGRLDVTFSNGKLTLDDYQPIPIDDTILGDPETIAVVDSMIAALDSNVWSQMDLTHDAPVAETSFDLRRIEGEESNLYDLVADAFREAAEAVLPAGTTVLAVEADVRNDLYAGQTGQLAAMDVYRAVPLGYGPSGTPGYPLVSFFLTGADLKKGMEVNASLVATGAAGGNYFLAISGLRYEYDPTGIPFDRVRALYLGNDVDGYSGTPMDISEGAAELYRIVATYYVGAMIGSVTDMTSGILEVTPRDENGDAITDMSTRLIDADPVATPGVVEELKAYQALFSYLAAFPDADADQIPDVPARYSDPQGSGRVKAVSP